MFGVTTYVESVEMLGEFSSCQGIDRKSGKFWGNLARKNSFTSEFGAMSVWLADTGSLLPFLEYLSSHF